MGTVWLGNTSSSAAPSPSRSSITTSAATPRDGPLEREAIAAARLDHENIVHIHDVRRDHGRPFIVNEFVDGEDLEGGIRKKSPLPVLRR